MAKLQKSGDTRHKRNKAEAKPRTIPGEWEDIFHAIGQHSFVLKPDYRIITCSKTAAVLKGQSAGFIRGRLQYEKAAGRPSAL
jgi:hypothetical protein